MDMNCEFRESFNILKFLLSNEDSVSSFLKGLMFFKPIRESLIRLFVGKDLGTQDVKFEDIYFQFVLNENQSRPDLAIINEKLKMLIEVKISPYRRLTENQPESYLEWLANQQGENLSLHFVAIIPPDYDYKSDLERRLCEFKDKKKSKEIHIKIINWLEIKKELQDNNLHLLSPYIADFCNLLSEWYENSVINFSLEEVNVLYSRETFCALSKLFNIIEKTVQQLETKEKIDEVSIHKAFRNKWWEDEYGVYFSFKNNVLLWFGIWSKAWRKYGSPLWIGVHKDCDKNIIELFKYKANKEKREYFKDCCVIIENYIVCSFAEKLLQDKDNYQKIIKFIRNYLESCLQFVYNED
ncbi:hypothetical protein [Thermosulfurimonas sp. F29]|uniref:hypothetical protein n=1 Tax=Thermosulfurimonas sp. F29 TaxID=2867247 RepID=UPI001C83C7C8|nr:hypothetical protein [Thermosulfurimonas sp. F29]MBX6422663.1 hypothetical protein [Thermosulfurimonas sp. F29]